MELSHLINIVNDITNRFEQPKLPYEHELKQELVNLSDFEKKIVKNHVNKLTYNCGTLNVLKILKKCEISSISDYLSKVNSMQEKLQIITDILDDKESYSLLEELLQTNNFENLLDIAFKNYVNDLINHQDIIQTEIIMETQKSLSSEIFTTSVLPRFLNHLFHFDFKNVNGLTDIVSNQKDWNLEYTSFKVLSQVIQNIMPLYNQIIIKEVCSLIQSGNSICWFFILMVIGFIKEEFDGFVEMKNVINTHMSTFCETSNINSLHKALILSRQLFHYNHHKKNASYRQWLKNNVGDLNYKLKKSKSAFSDVLRNLESLIPYENDLEVLQTHVSVQISAPSKEYSNVLEYKQLLRSREDALLKEDTEMTQISKKLLFKENYVI